MKAKAIVERAPPVIIVTVEIDDECYRVQRVEHPAQRLFRLRKLDGQREGTVYLVREMPGGLQVCDCQDFMYRRRACKHLLTLRLMGCLPATNENVSSGPARPLSISPAS